MKTPSHLGGHANRTHVDKGALKYMKKIFSITTMLDIGCGPGGMIGTARKLGIEATGIDGDPNIEHGRVRIWDYTKGPFPEDIGRFDLAWSVEFLEHVEARYIPNFMADFKRCKYAIVTHALPGKNGHHHVNCQPANYWVDVFREHGFELDFDATLEVRQKSTMEFTFMKQHGLVFRNAAEAA